ncbi:hypothetical protein PMZ80_005334 [Knufia obscura]|uniref:Uncharacterized protein n=2 Tax=Knufia TaxID=430999 RepID=A0AAN8FGA8_9EURO|nr:hypothetical protein PMZ80_005334 [Knufia obscura]KAK5958001.1 hypothetical protein OHC33_001191 [Knufia fluminis]
MSIPSNSLCILCLDPHLPTPTPCSGCSRFIHTACRNLFHINHPSPPFIKTNPCLICVLPRNTTDIWGALATKAQRAAAIRQHPSARSVQDAFPAIALARPWQAQPQPRAQNPYPYAPAIEHGGTYVQSMRTTQQQAHPSDQSRLQNSLLNSPFTPAAAAAVPQQQPSSPDTAVRRGLPDLLQIDAVVVPADPKDDDVEEYDVDIRAGPPPSAQQQQAQQEVIDLTEDDEDEDPVQQKNQHSARPRLSNPHVTADTATIPPQRRPERQCNACKYSRPPLANPCDGERPPCSNCRARFRYWRMNCVYDEP